MERAEIKYGTVFGEAQTAMRDMSRWSGLEALAYQRDEWVGRKLGRNGCQENSLHIEEKNSHWTAKSENGVSCQTILLSVTATSASSLKA